MCYSVKKVGETINDDNAYEKLSNNNDKTLINKMCKLLTELGGTLTQSEIKYLTNFEYKTSNF